MRRGLCLNINKYIERDTKMRRTIVWAGLCLALLVPACESQDQAIIEQTALVQEAPARPAPIVPAPTVAVTDTSIAVGVAKAMAANNETNRSARSIHVGETRKDVCGLPSVTFQKGDTYWSLCKTALRDPVATELAAEKAKRAELVRATDALAAEKAAIQTRWEQSYARWEASNATIERLQARIDARAAAAPAARTPAPAAVRAATTLKKTDQSKTNVATSVTESNHVPWIIGIGIFLAAFLIFVIWRFVDQSRKSAPNPTTTSSAPPREPGGPPAMFPED